MDTSKTDHIAIISDEQKKQINEELQKIKDNPSYLLNWNEVKHLLKFD